MYICEECGMFFEEPKVIFETHGLDTPPYEKLSVCPYCNENDIKESAEVECSRCGTLMPEDYAYIDDDLNYLCDVCSEDLGYA